MKLISTTLITAIIWLLVMVLTPPESEKVLEKFVLTVRPPGPGWRVWRERLDIEPVDSLKSLLLQFLLGSGLLFGALIGGGSFLLYQERGGWLGMVIAVFCFFGLSSRRLREI